MRFFRIFFFAFAAILFSGCAADYDGALGSHDEIELQTGVWRVSVVTNGYTNNETVQTYWLYRSAQLAIAKGYDGFEILSPIVLSSLVTTPDGEAHVIPAVFIPIIVPQAAFPQLSGEIRLIKKPFDEVPPKVFDAAKLSATLGVYVNGKRCELGNVCPHAHDYLYPAEKVEKRT